jgi:polyhydroxyalkanoate synthase
MVTMNLDYIQIMRNNFFNALEGIFPDIAVGKTSFQVADEDRLLNFKLLRYAKEEDNEKVLLIIPHIINRPYILDLNDDVSVIRKFCEKGFSVYMSDWGYPTMKQRKISFSDYANYLDKAVDFICKERGVKRVSVLGYCTGGIISLMYAALHPEKVGKLILLATPVDFPGGMIRGYFGERYWTFAALCPFSATCMVSLFSFLAATCLCTIFHSSL